VHATITHHRSEGKDSRGEKGTYLVTMAALATVPTAHPCEFLPCRKALQIETNYNISQTLGRQPPPTAIILYTIKKLLKYFNPIIYITTNKIHVFTMH
jgi:hypothetical protein